MPCFKLNAKHRFVVLDKYDHTASHTHYYSTHTQPNSTTHTNIIKIKI